MHLDVPPLRPTADGSALTAASLLESRVDILTEPVDPLRVERALQCDDPVGLQAAPDLFGVITVLGADGHHCSLPSAGTTRGLWDLYPKAPGSARAMRHRPPDLGTPPAGGVASGHPRCHVFGLPCRACGRYGPRTPFSPSGPRTPSSPLAAPPPSPPSRASA